MMISIVDIMPVRITNRITVFFWRVEQNGIISSGSSNDLEMAQNDSRLVMSSSRTGDSENVTNVMPFPLQMTPDLQNQTV